MNLFENKKIRSAWDKSEKKHWFSVVDVISALTSADYNTARNYWKWLKHKLRAQDNELVSVTTREPLNKKNKPRKPTK